MTAQNIYFRSSCHISSQTMSLLSAWPAWEFYFVLFFFLCPFHTPRCQRIRLVKSETIETNDPTGHRNMFFSHLISGWYPAPTLPSSGATTHSPSPVSLGHLPQLRGQDRTGEDKLQPLSPGSLSCFHLHRQLISHHWRALACQAEDFIRDVLYGS